MTENLSFKCLQCLIKSDFALPDETCIADPRNCNNGLSFSIWEKVIYEEEVLNVNKEHGKKYIFSTGADTENDKSFPGMALYHVGMDLVAVVSTGDDVWQLRVRGQLSNESWSNIGVRWEPFTVSTFQGGLELYVNNEKIGHAHLPIKRPNSGMWSVVEPSTEPLTTLDEEGTD